MVFAHRPRLPQAEDVVQAHIHERHERRPGLGRLHPEVALNRGQYPAMYSFAPAMSVIPARASSSDRRRRRVRNRRSHRPRGCGEDDGIISIPNSTIARPNRVGVPPSTLPPTLGVCR